MQKLPYVAAIFGLTSLVFVSGCATYPDCMTAEKGANIRVVGIADEISTPTFLVTPGIPNAAGVAGAIVVAGVKTSQQSSLTAQVRSQFDFQSFAAETLRESFAKAVKRHPGWMLAEPSQKEKADAVFVLRVKELGVDRGHSHDAFIYKFEHQPTVTITATLIGNPPFDCVAGSGDVVKVLEPERHPILYHRKEQISNRCSGHMGSHAAHGFVTNGSYAQFNWKYSGDAKLTQEAFREAIELAVKRIESSWDGSGKPK